MSEVTFFSRAASIWRMFDVIQESQKPRALFGVARHPITGLSLALRAGSYRLTQPGSIENLEVALAGHDARASQAVRTFVTLVKQRAEGETAAIVVTRRRRIANRRRAASAAVGVELARNPATTLGASIGDAEECRQSQQVTDTDSPTVTMLRTFVKRPGASAPSVLRQQHTQADNGYGIVTILDRLAYRVAEVPVFTGLQALSKVGV